MTTRIYLQLVYISVFAVTNIIRAQIQGMQTEARKLLLGRELLQSSNEECQIDGEGYYQELSGGVPAPKGRYPYMIAIQLQKGNQFQHHCGGTLIAPNLILTAAHCIYVYQGTPRDYDFRVSNQLKGKLKTYAKIYAARNPRCRHQKGEEDRILINQYYLNSDYSGNLGRGGDIAILQTQKSFDYKGPFINYASSIDVSLDASRLFSALGYGATNIQDLNSRAVDVIPLQLGFFTYEKDDICQLKLRLDTCAGDSGGPMLLADDNYGVTPIGDPSKDIQVGITSWGVITNCTPGDQNNPGVYTKVSNYVDWIASVIASAGEVVTVKATATSIASASTLLPASSPAQMSTSSSAEKAFFCSDKKPPGVFTCQQQLLFGKCDASWMISGQYCQKTCGRCLLGIDDFAGPTPTPNTAPSNGEGCSDIQPPGQFTCDQQRQFQKCDATWMINSNYCQKTCGRCGGDATGAGAMPVARSTLQCFGEPQANYKGEIILLGTENFKDSVWECCTSCDENPYCNVYVYCPRLEGCRNLDKVLNYGRCDLKFQQAVEDGKEPEVWYRGNQTDSTSGYIFAKNNLR